jgi:hypothetical protein
MSDEQHRDEEPEVEAHSRQSVNIEPAADEDENDFEAHVRQSNVRLDSPRQG